MNHIQIEGVKYIRESDMDRLVRERVAEETEELKRHWHRAEVLAKELQKSMQHWRKIAEAELKNVTVIMQDNLAQWHQQGHELTVAVDSHNPELVAWFVDGRRYVPAEIVESAKTED